MFQTHECAASTWMTHHVSESEVLADLHSTLIGADIGTGSDFATHTEPAITEFPVKYSF